MAVLEEEECREDGVVACLIMVGKDQQAAMLPERAAVWETAGRRGMEET